MGSGLTPLHPDWGPQPTISEEDLTLRPFHHGDAWSIRAWDHDPQTQRFFEFPPLPPPDEHLRRIWWVIGKFHRGYERGERLPFVVTHASAGEVLGSVELHDVRGADAEISYMTVPGHRGEGIATRAVQLLFREAPARFGISQVTLEHHVENRASEAVAYRVGFKEIERQGDAVRYVMQLIGGSSASSPPVR
jgi:RimJ/RimL family protein N-acetyltransferase